MSLRTYFLAMLLPATAIAGWSDSQPGIEAVSWNVTINNSVSGTIVDSTWDPGDPVTISGTLIDNFNGTFPENCYDSGNVLADYDSVIVFITPAEDPGNDPGHKVCGGSTRLAFSPGTNAYGEFSIVLQGGGVSWLLGDGDTYRGAYIRLLFKEPGRADGNVILGDSSQWGLAGCSSAPLVYGELASPDLDGDLFVDNVDAILFSTYFLGNAVTASSGWQADFNHTGNQVDSGDTAYFAGRLGVDCSSSKAGNGDYQMRISNLLDPEVLAFLSTCNMTPAQVIAQWDQMGLTYDSSLVAVAIEPNSVVQQNWSNVKRVFK